MRENKNRLPKGYFWLKKNLSGNGAFLALIALTVIAAVIYQDMFFSYTNLSNVLRQSSMIGLIAIGMTCVILTAGIDLSVGATVALSAVLAAKMSGQSFFLAVTVPILAGLCIGFVNGFIISRLKIVPFIATLAVQMAVRGITYIMTDIKSISVSKDLAAFPIIGRGYYYGIPIPVLIFSLAAVSMIFVCKSTSFGRSLYAIGGNEEAAKMMGLKVNRNKIICYTMTGGLSALAGVILCSRLGAGQPVAGLGWEMDAVAAVAIGGTLLSGGVGSIAKTISGVLIVSLIGNIINLQGNVNTYIQKIIMGAIVLAVIIVQKRTRKKET